MWRYKLSHKILHFIRMLRNFDLNQKLLTPTFVHICEWQNVARKSCKDKKIYSSLKPRNKYSGREQWRNFKIQFDKIISGCFGKMHFYLLGYLFKQSKVNRLVRTLPEHNMEVFSYSRGRDSYNKMLLISQIIYFRGCSAPLAATEFHCFIYAHFFLFFSTRWERNINKIQY